MIPSLLEIKSSARGAWRLFFWDPEALEDFNLSIDGFWHSFAVPVLLLPAYFYFFREYYQLSYDLAAQGTAIDPEIFGNQGAFVWRRVLIFGIGIITMPLAGIVLSQLMNFTHRYIHLVVAMNWGHVVALGLYLLPVLLYSTSILSIGVASAFWIMIFFTVLIYQFAIIRLASELPIPMSALALAIFACVDFLVSLLFGMMLSI